MSQPRQRSRASSRIRLVPVAVAAALASLGLAACGGDDSSITSAPTPGDARLGHVHGIGVDPADGEVYVGAHYGVFKITGPGQAVRVAGRTQDTMGFTVTGPKTFLASGHPAMAEMRKGAEPHLGLIRSQDAGNTWTTVSDGGRADFHSIQSAGKNLYVFDSQTGRVRRSGDQGRTWTSGARLNVADLAARPPRPDQVYATTPQGIQVSDDGGATFTPMPKAPILTHLDVVGGELVGVDPNGQVRTGLSGEAWQERGRVPGGQASAFTAVNGQRLLAAVENGTLYDSRDGGRNFTVLYRPARG